jgi:hypothetical protein
MDQHADRIAVIESPEYEATRQRLVEDPIVKALAAELSSGIAEGHTTKADMLHDDGAPRFEMMQRCNAEYARRGGVAGGHIGAVAEAIVRIWSTPQVPHVQLVERPDGEWVAIRFPSLQAARAWQDEVEEADSTLTFRGCVPVTDVEAAS